MRDNLSPRMGRRPLAKEHPHVRKLYERGLNRETIGSMLNMSPFQVGYRLKAMGIKMTRGRPRNDKGDAQ